MVGMGDVLRAFIKQLPDKQHRYIPRKLRNGLILVAGKYEGRDHEPKEIVQPMHNKKLRAFVKEEFFSHVLDNPDFMNFMLRRFDTTNPGAVMY
jgi:hypothetical protein